MSSKTNSGGDILGLNLVLAKKSRPDLDSLAHVDLSTGVEYATPASTAPQPGLSIAERPDSSVGYVKHTGQLRLPNGTLARYESRIIAGPDLDKVTVYKGNPRATTNPDVSGLRSKVAKSGGNIVPVIARELADGTVEVIAGSRRTKAVKEEELALLANVIIEPITEVLARQLAYIENDAREDPDVFEEATFFSTTYDTYKSEGLVDTIEGFGRLFGHSKVNMGRYINIATIPSWLISMCPRSQTDLQGTVKPMWSLRKAEELWQFYKAHSERIDGEIKSQITQHQCGSPEEVIRLLKKTLDKPTIATNKSSLSFKGKEVGYMETGKRKNTLKVFLSEDAPVDIVSQIKSLLEQIDGIG